MSYRLTDVTDLPRSPQALLTLVHPMSAVDIVGRILSPYTTTSASIENLDPTQRRSEVLAGNLPPRLLRALKDH
ncbi:hypothetical protein KUV44_12450 [Marinobacter daepoensis]|uniref:Uncharacterized protein n=1 Tax=Marinobacter daepoensis TaxID=262077 RepID=A0ABS3BIP9_9GAMM|nr:hypothetical protein [Marinobacter daepoensis]MBN7771352.1 hypothetical protein [Marinobacter daepoensis]MBY6079953.1 hypothetical protein [Marinobacter daepoensis]